MEIEDRLEELWGKAQVWFAGFDERLEFGSSAPDWSREHWRSNATRAPGLWPLTSLFKPYSRHPEDYPQIEVVSYDLLGRVAAGLASRHPIVNQEMAQTQASMLQTINTFFESRVSLSLG